MGDTNVSVVPDDQVDDDQVDEVVPDDQVVSDDGEIEEEIEADAAAEAAAGPAPKWSAVKVTLIFGLVVVVVLGGLVGWLGYRAYQAAELERHRIHFLEVGRQGALNLTSIDFEHVDADVQRVLDGASGTFYDQFEKRAAPYAELVKQVKSKSVGNVTESGVESATDTEAHVLVAVTVNTSINGQPDGNPRSFRMRIHVEEAADGQAKVSSVEFVP